MATKLKKPKPLLTFLIYLISFSLFLITGIVAISEATMLSTDYKKTENYTYNVIPELLNVGYAYTLNMPPLSRDGDYSAPSDENGTTWSSWVRNTLAKEGDNLAYLMLSPDGTSISNGTTAKTPEEFTTEFQQQLDRSFINYKRFMPQASYEGYDHLLVLRGNMLYEAMNSRSNTHGYDERTVRLTNTIYQSAFAQETFDKINALSETDAVFCLAVRSEGTLLNNYGGIYSSYYYWYLQWITVIILGFTALASLLVFLGTRLRKQSMDIARAKLAAFSGWFWVEIKLLCALIAILITFIVLDQSWFYDAIFPLVPTVWGLWLLGNDFRYNGAAVIHHNSLHSFKCALQRFDSKYPFCARMKRRIALLLVAEFSILFLCFFMAMIFGGLGVFLDLFFVALGLALLVLYVKTYLNDIDDFGKIVGYVSQIRFGAATQPLQIPSEHAFYPVAADLNDIHSGMMRMVDERVRSEQMKVELITNVSHDLKTPLTSIINYVNLLAREKLTPDYANEYVNVLTNKTERLKNLVQDLFEISKANSGAIDLNLEQLCVCSLVEQTVAELDQRTEQAGVDIKLQLCPPPVMVRADGKKLHRVFENLLGNALKYSMTGTRVYIDVQKNENFAQITIKNVAGYEMNFTAEDIVERFQRGDASRTSEGSGLGLAIAKSFLELNGGSLKIELDGDLFKAIVCLPLYFPYTQRATAPQETPDTNPPASAAELSAAAPETPISEAVSPVPDAQPIPPQDAQEDAPEVKTD